MLKWIKKHEDKEKVKINHEVARSINHKVTQTEKNTGSAALERNGQ